jgi:hypothetical protein
MKKIYYSSIHNCDLMQNLTSKFGISTSQLISSISFPLSGHNPVNILSVGLLKVSWLVIIRDYTVSNEKMKSE